MVGDQHIERVGFVAIGRNEGDRLKRCLTSLKTVSPHVVYVDSGSEDESVAFAQSIEVAVVSLDMSSPFTAARARNAGFERLKATSPEIEKVMFIDGDCELAVGFPAAAAAALDKDDNLGIVTGRCIEARRDATIYNKLCDFEWDGPIGEIDACGGIFMVNRAAFEAVGGFDASVIAAEDDEFCIRVRKVAKKNVQRIDEAMCFHDANITRFAQWWTRSVRAGSAYAQVGSMHQEHFKSERLRSWAWGLILPIVTVTLAPFTAGLSLLGFGLYPVSYWRTRRNLMRGGMVPSDAGLYARFLTLSKFPNAIGMLDYWLKKMSGRDIKIKEYK